MEGCIIKGGCSNLNTRSYSDGWIFPVLHSLVEAPAAVKAFTLAQKQRQAADKVAAIS